MSLYLCVLKDDIELDGVEVGHYSDFGFFRESVLRKAESGNRGSRFPVLMSHSDSEGFWTVEEARLLERELSELTEILKQLPPEGFEAEWQKGIAKSIGLNPSNLYECFIDVDGEPLIERLIFLCRLAQQVGAPILFQ